MIFELFWVESLRLDHRHSEGGRWFFHEMIKSEMHKQHYWNAPTSGNTDIVLKKHEEG